MESLLAGVLALAAGLVAGQHPRVAGVLTLLADLVRKRKPPAILLLVLFVLPLVAAGALAVEPRETPAQRRERDAVRESLVRVRCGHAQGSGTVVWSRGGRSVVLTAGHVVAGPGELSVRGGGKTHKGELLGRDAVADLAALLVSADLPAVRVASKDPADGAHVLMMGVTSLWSRGELRDRGKLDRMDVYTLGYESDAGDSGGGVFCGGELVGVHCGKAWVNGPDEPPVAYCAAAKPVRVFLSTVIGPDGPRPPPAPKGVEQPAAKKVIGYRCQIVNGRKVCVPVYEP